MVGIQMCFVVEPLLYYFSWHSFRVISASRRKQIPYSFKWRSIKSPVVSCDVIRVSCRRHQRGAKLSQRCTTDDRNVQERREWEYLLESSYDEWWTALTRATWWYNTVLRYSLFNIITRRQCHSKPPSKHYYKIHHCSISAILVFWKTRKSVKV